MLHFIELPTTPSTNTYLSHIADEMLDGTVVYTDDQTAGRGQKGNHWESEKGKNLTFSQLIKSPAVAARDQFCISQAVAVAVAQTLAEVIQQPFCVKWPNDIYWHDRKVCGMLIENSLQGATIDYSIAGVGINVNQQHFVSDAPNPVSLHNITGQDYDTRWLLQLVCERIEQEASLLADNVARQSLHQRYMALLYRHDGALHPFEDDQGHTWLATIESVALDGVLTLRHQDGSSHHYLFKQVKHVINQLAL